MPSRSQSPIPLAPLVAAGLLAACTSVPGSGDGSDGRAGDARGAREPAAQERLAYPDARRADQVDVYHGVEVADPYRWLEDPDTPEARAWIEAQNALSEGWLAAVSRRGALRERVARLWDYERFGSPELHGGKLFYTRNDGLQDQDVLFVADDEEGRGARVLLDPNTLSADGTVALAAFAPSPDGTLLAYGLSDGGSDWHTWRVRDVASGADLADVVTRNKFGDVDWAADGRGFYYTRFDRPAEGEELQERNAPPDVAYHRLGTDEAQDPIVVQRPADDGVFVGFSLTDARDALVVMRWHSASRTNEIDLVPVSPEEPGAAGAPTQLITGFDAQYQYVGDDGRTLWFQTDLDAPRWRIVGIDPGAPQRESWRTVVPEAENAIEGAGAVGGRLLVSYLRDATSDVRVFSPEGEPLGRVELPGLGTAGGFSGDFDDRVTFYTFTGFTRPAEVWRYDVATGESRLFRRPTVDFDPEEYVTEQVFYASTDGTRVPMFLVRRRGIEASGDVPTYLYGYGGFAVSLTPGFSPANLAWLELGGLLAIPNLRGGGEYGEAWHAAGTKLLKQNVFDDFLAAAEWLIDSGWTSPQRLAIGGGSNGGLLVGACITQRPELFGAALPAVGVLDMLRYHLFTIGWAWAGDYGTVDDAEEFRALLAYSPLHNVRPGTCYPPTLITTADHDDRVVPAHSFKFAAALQAAQGCAEPILIRIETRAGHGAGKPTSMRIDEAADRWAFLVRALGMERKSEGRP